MFLEIYSKYETFTKIADLLPTLLNKQNSHTVFILKINGSQQIKNVVCNWKNVYATENILKIWTKDEIGPA